MIELKNVEKNVEFVFVYMEWIFLYIVQRGDVLCSVNLSEAGKNDKNNWWGRAMGGVCLMNKV